MSDANTSDIDAFEEDEARPLRAPASDIVRYYWRRWISQPGYLFGFFALYALAVTCDLSLPAVSGGLVEALSKGPGVSRDQAITAFGFFTVVAFGFYFFRNTSVRFW